MRKPDPSVTVGIVYLLIEDTKEVSTPRRMDGGKPLSLATSVLPQYTYPVCMFSFVFYSSVCLAVFQASNIGFMNFIYNLFLYVLFFLFLGTELLLLKKRVLFNRGEGAMNFRVIFPLYVYIFGIILLYL